MDHVGIGADFCGVTLQVFLKFSVQFSDFIHFRTPEGAEDVSKYPVLFAVLLEQGWTEQDLGKLASKNLIRVLREVEKVSSELKDMEPYQDWIPIEDYLPGEKTCKSE